MIKIQVSQPQLTGRELEYVTDCVSSGWISSIGQYINRFEETFASHVGVDHAATCSNGTVALHLALLALGIKEGDEVIIPTLTYVATANAVRYCGATPIFVDSEEDTMNLCPADVKKAISSRTRAVIAVHLYGHPADLDEIVEICAPRGIAVIEDAAEAHGAKIGERVVGSIGDIATFSFFGNKIVTTGEGGMVTTQDKSLDDSVRLYRGQGQDPGRRYWFPVVGYNYRMTNVAAAIGLAQVEDMEKHLSHRERVGNAYDRFLESTQSLLTLPVTRDGFSNVRWLYTVVLKDSVAKPRDVVMAELESFGIETRPVFYPMHQLPPYRTSSSKYPIADRLSSRGISLPTHGGLSESQIEYVSDSLKTVLGLR